MTEPTQPMRVYAAPKQVHLFVNTVRFWSMFAIVAMHSVMEGTAFFGSELAFQRALISPLKFGTIAFFLISGFLLGERMQTSRPTEYLGRRLRKVFLPWLVWFSAMVVFLLAADTFHHRTSYTLANDGLRVLGEQVSVTLIGTAFWFVPNLLLAISILLVFRRKLHSVWFGVVLFAINGVYVANIYRNWFESSHPKALFAFVSYLWLGSFAARHFGRLERLLDRISAPVLLGVTALSCAVSFGESQLLARMGAADPVNSLRLSNQVFSVMAVLFLMKLRKQTWPRFIDVRGQTFGIYLTHSMLLTMVFDVVRRLLRAPEVMQGTGRMLGSATSFTIFAATYGGCLLLTRWMGRQESIGWTVGAEMEGEGRKRQVTNGLENQGVKAPELRYT